MEINRGCIKRKIWPALEKEIRDLYLSGAMSQTAIAAKYGLTQSWVSRIISKNNEKG